VLKVAHIDFPWKSERSLLRRYLTTDGG